MCINLKSDVVEVKRITAQPKDEISSTEESQSSVVRTVALWVGKSMITMLLLIFFVSLDFIYVNLVRVSFRFSQQ